ncbi:hypothetical protein [Geminisphaera colitermitum]|uniref:hypothetical protein n=1 Tax=Geminisphaera colitermitum TaxID=1148786 RepID=UPI000158CFE1|nr:hypothetical protein [Geminisphaera colitermitum]
MKPQTTKPQYRGELIPDLAQKTAPEIAETVNAHLTVYSQMREVARRIADCGSLTVPPRSVNIEAAKNWMAALDTLMSGMIDARERVEVKLYLRRMPPVPFVIPGKPKAKKGAASK